MLVKTNEGDSSMHRFLRNSVLALLLIGAASSQNKTLAQSVNNGTGSPGLQLNVVFHGLFAYIIRSDGIEVLAPQVDEHVYKAGTWGKEFPLKESVVYEMQGVRGEMQPPSIDAQNNLVLKSISNIDRSPAKLFCSFKLPLPTKIIGLRMVHSGAGRPIFEGSAAAQLPTKAVPLIQTFVYQIDDIRKLQLSKFAWQPEIVNNQTVNLHIWAEPDVEMEGFLKSHSSQAFSRLMALFPGVDLRLGFSAGAEPDTVTGVPGLNGWEERTLIERYRLLFPPTNQSHQKGAEIANCIGVIVINN